MEYNQLCNLNILESSTKSFDSLSDLLLKNTDPNLFAVNESEDAEDNNKLMLYQTDDLISYVDIKFNNSLETYQIPVQTVPHCSNVVLDLVDLEDSSNIDLTDNQVLTIETATDIHPNGDVVVIQEDQRNVSNENVFTDGTESFISFDNIDFVIDESCMPVATAGSDSEGKTKELNKEIDDEEDAITEALQSLGINKEYFISSTGGKNSKKQQLWSCPIVNCNFTSVNLNTFKIHLLKHFDKKPFKCKLTTANNTPCMWGFFSKHKLLRHMTSHDEDKKCYPCDQKNCNKRFTTLSNLKMHMLRHGKPLTLCCEELGCGRKFQTMKQYSTHLKEHSNVSAPYMCDYKGCGKSFYLMASLKSHQRVHVTNPEDLVCKGCGKQFKVPCRLREHYKAVHESTKNFKCTHDGCKLLFSTKSALKRHNKSKHLNMRMFPCPLVTCGKSFLRSEHLQEHMLQHNENKPKFTCPYQDCLMSYVAKSSLYAHLKHVHSTNKIT